MAPRPFLAACGAVCYFRHPTGMHNGRGVAQSGSALARGARGRWFKSSRPDHFIPAVSLALPAAPRQARAAWRDRLTDRVATACYLVAAAVARGLPRRAAYTIAAALGTLRYLGTPALRRTVRANVRRALPPTHALAREATVCAIYRSFARTVVDVLRLPEWTPAAVRMHVRVEGGEAFTAAAARGRGVVIVSAHLGSWEVGGAYLATLGIPVHVVARRHDAPGVQRFFRARRERLGLHVVDSGAPLRALLGPLRRGECVAMLADRPVLAHARPVVFCGEASALPRGPVALALRSGAALLAAVALREGAGFRVIWREVCVADLPGTASGIHTGVARMARTLEPWVRGQVRQWYAFEPVWPAAATSGPAPSGSPVVRAAAGRSFA